MQKKRVLSVALILLFMTATIVGVNLSASADATGSFLPNDVTGEAESITETEPSSNPDTDGVIASGTCGAQGDNLTWTLDSEGTLTISGEGEMQGSFGWNGERAPWKSYRTEISSVVIENGVTHIGSSAFYNCSSLVNVIIADSVITIGDNVYGYDGNERGAFENCINLISVTLSKELEKIGVRTFECCTNLSNIVIGDNVKKIGAAAFGYCAQLKEIIIPERVTEIGDYAFVGCAGLEKITWNAVNVESVPVAWWFQNAGADGNGIDLVFGDSVKTIPANMCCNMNLKSVTIPDSVTTIGSFAFSGCTGLTGITIPENVTSIGNSAFYVCAGLSEITIPDSVTSIGTTAFSGCSGLTSVTLSNNIATIPQNAFANCTSLETIVLPESVSYVAVNAFLNAGLKDIEIRNSRCVIEYDAATIPVGAVIHGYVNSPAQLYAQMYARDFVPFEATDCAHTYSAWTVDAEATCTERGLSHRSCLLCGDVDIAITPATGHTDENGDDLCDVCGASLAANVPGGDDTPCVTHTYSDWVIDAEPTCTERGLSHRTCRKCGDLEISVIPATGHTDENGDDLCDVCGVSLAPEEPGEDEPTENGLMKIMQKIVDFFSRLAAWLKSMFAKTA